MWRLLNAVCAHHVTGADCVITTTVEAWCPIDSTRHRRFEGKDLHMSAIAHSINLIQIWALGNGQLHATFHSGMC